MGDRANMYLIDDDQQHGIYVYTHWSGYAWPEKLRSALAFGDDRWNDSQYLFRIIISRVFVDLVDETTGGGVSTVIGDNEHPIIVVNMDDLTVSFAQEGLEKNPSRWYGTMSFREYSQQEKADYPSEGSDD